MRIYNKVTICTDLYSKVYVKEYIKNIETEVITTACNV